MFFIQRKSTSSLRLHRWPLLTLLGCGLLYGAFNANVQAQTSEDKEHMLKLAHYPELWPKVLSGMNRDIDELKAYIKTDPDYKTASPEAQNTLRKNKYKQIRKQRLREYIKHIRNGVAYIKTYLMRLYTGIAGVIIGILGLWLYKLLNCSSSGLHKNIFQRAYESIYNLLYEKQDPFQGGNQSDGPPEYTLTQTGKIVMFLGQYSIHYILAFLSMYIVSLLWDMFHEIYFDYETYNKYKRLKNVEDIKDQVLEVENMYIKYLPQLTYWTEKRIIDEITHSYKYIVHGEQDIETIKRIDMIRKNIVPEDKQHPMRELDEKALNELQKEFTNLKNGDEQFKFWRQLLLRIEAKKKNAKKENLLSHEVKGKRDIVLISGKPGTGKSFITKDILKKFNIPHIIGDLSGNIFEHISMLNGASRAPLVMVLDDGDRYLRNKDISTVDLAFFDPAKKYVTCTYKGESAEIRLPDMVILIVNDEIEDAAIQDRFTLKFKVEGFTPEGKRKIIYDQLKKEVAQLQASGYQKYISMDDFISADYKELDACINPNSASIREEFNELNRIVYNKLAYKLTGHSDSPPKKYTTQLTLFASRGR